MNPAKPAKLALKIAKAALVVAGSYIILASLPFGCGPCGEESIGEAYSPGGKYLARAYVRDCGATTGWLTHVNLRPRWSWFKTHWYGTVTDGQVFANACWSKVEFVWRDESHLEIQYEKCPPRDDAKDPVSMRESAWEGVNISYREKPRAGR